MGFGLNLIPDRLQFAIELLLYIAAIHLAAGALLSFSSFLIAFNSFFKSK